MRIVSYVILFLILLSLVSFRSRTNNKVDRIEENIFLFEKSSTGFEHPFFVEKFPYLKFVVDTNNTLALMFDIAREQRDSLFFYQTHKFKKFEYVHKYFDILEINKNQVSIRYSKSNRDFDFLVNQTSKLGSGGNYKFYQNFFRLCLSRRGLRILGSNIDGNLETLCSYKYSR